MKTSQEMYTYAERLGNLAQKVVWVSVKFPKPAAL